MCANTSFWTPHEVTVPLFVSILFQVKKSALITVIYIQIGNLGSCFLDFPLLNFYLS